MSLRQIIFALRAHYRVALLVLFATVAITIAIASNWPKRYTATATIVVDVRSPDPLASLTGPVNLLTQVEIINSDRVAQRVVKMLRLNESPTINEQWKAATDSKGKVEVWLGEVLQKQLSVKASNNSNVINISFIGADPVFAAAVANAFAQAYIEATVEFKVEPARQYALWFGDQGKSLRDALEKAQTRLSEFQQKNGIVANTEQLDTETSKLNDLSAQLTRVQTQNSDLRSKQKSSNSAETLPDVYQNTVVSGLRNQVIQLEAKLQEGALNLGRNHPQYLRMEAEITALRQKLEVETRRITNSFSTSGNVGSDVEAELNASVAAQKRKLLQLKSLRDQLAVLQRDVDSAKNAYDTVISRYTQSNLASQATQTNASVLNPALEPQTPSSPKPLQTIILISVALGLLLGIGGAVGLEMIDRRVRSTEDLAEMLQMPVLAVIERPRRRLAIGRSKAILALR